MQFAQMSLNAAWQAGRANFGDPMWVQTQAAAALQALQLANQQVTQLQSKVHAEAEAQLKLASPVIQLLTMQPGAEVFGAALRDLTDDTACPPGGRVEEGVSSYFGLGLGRRQGMAGAQSAAASWGCGSGGLREETSTKKQKSSGKSKAAASASAQQAVTSLKPKRVREGQESTVDPPAAKTTQATQRLEEASVSSPSDEDSEEGDGQEQQLHDTTAAQQQQQQQQAIDLIGCMGPGGGFGFGGVSFAGAAAGAAGPSGGGMGCGAGLCTCMQCSCVYTILVCIHRVACVYTTLSHLCIPKCAGAYCHTPSCL